MAKILIVDDSGFSRRALRRILEEHGYEVIEAESGGHALEILRRFLPDIITLDLLMPGMSGQETLENVRRIAPQARIIVLTADVQDATRKELLEMGADAFLYKPVGREALLSAIERILLAPET